MCTHHWIIDCKNQGKCNLCGEHKDFQKDNARVFKYNNKCLQTGSNILGTEYYMQGSIPKEFRFEFDKICVL